MHVGNLAKLFLNLFTLRAKPSDIPYSKTLLLFFSIVFLLSKSAVYVWFIHIANRFDTHLVMHVTYGGALMVAVVCILLLFALLRTTLHYYKMLDRFVQLAIGFVAMDCFLTALFLIWLCGLAVVHLPLAGASLGTIGIMLGFVLMMYWQFMVYIHLLVFGMDLPIIKAGFFTLFYMLLQHNVAEIILNVIVSVQKLGA